MDREDYGSVKINLKELVKQPLETTPTEKSSDLRSLTLFGEEDIGIATDSKAECVAGLTLGPNLSKQRRSDHGQAISVALKPVLVSKGKCEQLPRKNS